MSTFLALDRVDRFASLEAMFALSAAAVLVRIVRPRHWRERFGPAANSQGASIVISCDLATVRRIRLAVARAQRNVPTNPNCLPQAIAARWMLGRRGIVATLFLGSERDDAGQHRFHAWLKVGGEWVTGHCDEDRYSLLLPTGPETA